MRNREHGLTRRELSGLAGIATGGTFSDYLSALRRRGLAEERGRRVFPGSIIYLWEEQT